MLQTQHVRLAFGPRLNNTELFRFFETESYASDFLNGRIWISTLSSCRRAEGAERGDVGEGAFTHHIDYMRRGDDPKLFDAAMAQTGIFTTLHDDSTIQGMSFVGGDPDMYILCFTECLAKKEMETGFGKWAVRISRPMDFFHIVTRSIAELIGIDQAAMGPVEYIGREMANYEAARVPKFFLKPKDGYSHQQEVRMLWNRANVVWAPSPFLLPCPEVAAMCSLVSRGA